MSVPSGSVLPGAEPFAHDGGDVGVLLCHGFTGTPQSLRPWAQRLADAGYTVRLPLLAGHGTAWQRMQTTGWPDWYATVDAALGELVGCRVVVVGGLSMGGALALRLAQQRHDRVAGLILVNPSIMLAAGQRRMLTIGRRLVRSVPGVGSDIKRPGVVELAYPRTPVRAAYSLTRLHDEVTAHLAAVDQPVLLFRSLEDHVVPGENSALVLAGVSSTEVAEVLCPDSYHVATLDNDADRIIEGSLAFIARMAAGARP